MPIRMLEARLNRTTQGADDLKKESLVVVVDLNDETGQCIYCRNQLGNVVEVRHDFSLTEKRPQWLTTSLKHGRAVCQKCLETWYIMSSGALRSHGCEPFDDDLIFDWGHPGVIGYPGESAFEVKQKVYDGAMPNGEVTVTIHQERQQYFGNIWFYGYKNCMGFARLLPEDRFDESKMPFDPKMRLHSQVVRYINAIDAGQFSYTKHGMIAAGLSQEIESKYAEL